MLGLSQFFPVLTGKEEPSTLLPLYHVGQSVASKPPVEKIKAERDADKLEIQSFVFVEMPPPQRKSQQSPQNTKAKPLNRFV